MTKNQKTLLWSVIGLFVATVIFFIVRNKQLKDKIENGTKPPTGTTTGGSTGSGSSSTLPPTSGTGTGTGTTTPPATTTPTTTAPYIGTDSSKWNLACTIKANVPVNIYSDASLGADSLVKTIPAGTTIGNYMGTYAGSTKKVKYLYTNWIGYSSIQDGFILLSSGNVSNTN